MILMILKSQIGISTCSKKDKFEPTKGEIQALGRAKRNTCFSSKEIRTTLPIEEIAKVELDRVFAISTRGADIFAHFMNSLRSNKSSKK